MIVATWSHGVFVCSEGLPKQERAGHSVRVVVADGQGGALAIFDRHSLCRRSPDGVWSTIATTEMDLSCCVLVDDFIYIGTDDALILRVNPAGTIEQLPGFEKVAGRDKWYAGSMVVEGRRVGPPLGVRSITATSDGKTLLANVHVGGIPRSTDGGATWQPTIDIGSDVHEVRAHPNRPNIAAAAAAIGLCVSTDGGATWEVEQRGLHALHCSAVAFAGEDILVSAAESPFAPLGAIYRRGIGENCPLVQAAGGLPEWLERGVDTHCIAAHGSVVAVADRGGNLYLSADHGHSWSRRAEDIPGPSSILIL